MNLRSQLVAEAESFRREQKLSTVQNAKISKVMVEQISLGNSGVNVVDQPRKKISVLLLHYSAYKAQTFYAQVRIFAKCKEEEEFLPILYVIFKSDEYIFLHIVWIV